MAIAGFPPFLLHPAAPLVTNFYTDDGFSLLTGGKSGRNIPVHNLTIEFLYEKECIKLYFSFAQRNVLWSEQPGHTMGRKRGFQHPDCMQG